ncbi:hypothetical protein FACS189415_8090 [Bacteroidia bacterium]|nr:hypothetical protein FACS189415_8090 [Bacteroidia bacterium]
METGKGFKLPGDKTGKDRGKAACANACIGFGVTHRESSTGTYLMDAGRRGIAANYGIVLRVDTVAFVSVASEGAYVEQTVLPARAVIKAGGTVVMDASGTGFGKSHSKHNRNGEGKVQDALGTPPETQGKGIAYLVISITFNNI